MKQNGEPSAFDTGLEIMREMERGSRVQLTSRERDASDSDQLELELNYRRPRNDRRFFKTHPPGYNVMTGLGAFFAVGGFLVGALLTVSFLGRGGLGEPVGLAVGLVTGGFAGAKLPAAIWRGMGAGLRSVLRIPGYLGGGAIVVMMLIMFSVLVQGVRAVVEGTPESMPSSRATTSPIVTASPMATASPTAPSQLRGKD